MNDMDHPCRLLLDRLLVVGHAKIAQLYSEDGDVEAEGDGEDAVDEQLVDKSDFNAVDNEQEDNAVRADDGVDTNDLPDFDDEDQAYDSCALHDKEDVRVFEAQSGDSKSSVTAAEYAARDSAIASECDDEVTAHCHLDDAMGFDDDGKASDTDASSDDDDDDLDFLPDPASIAEAMDEGMVGPLGRCMHMFRLTRRTVELRREWDALVEGEDMDANMLALAADRAERLFAERHSRLAEEFAVFARHGEHRQAVIALSSSDEDVSDDNIASGCCINANGEFCACTCDHDESSLQPAMETRLTPQTTGHTTHTTRPTSHAMFHVQRLEPQRNAWDPNHSRAFTAEYADYHVLVRDFEEVVVEETVSSVKAVVPQKRARCESRENSVPLQQS